MQKNAKFLHNSESSSEFQSKAQITVVKRRQFADGRRRVFSNIDGIAALLFVLGIRHMRKDKKLLAVHYRQSIKLLHNLVEMDTKIPNC